MYPSFLKVYEKKNIINILIIMQIPTLWNGRLMSYLSKKKVIEEETCWMFQQGQME